MYECCILNNQLNTYIHACINIYIVGMHASYFFSWILASYICLVGGIDYSYGSGSPLYMKFIFSTGMMITSFSVKIINDATFEQNETFKFTIDPISLPYDMTVGEYAESMITIVDDDCKYCSVR